MLCKKEERRNKHEVEVERSWICKVHGDTQSFSVRRLRGARYRGIFVELSGRMTCRGPGKRLAQWAVHMMCARMYLQVDLLVEDDINHSHEQRISIYLLFFIY